jgi:hypothetical protein
MLIHDDEEKKMKIRMFEILLTISIFILFVSATAIAETYEAPKASAAPAIDGNLADWAGAPVLSLGGDTWEANGGTWDNEADLSATLMIMWDNGNLYVGSVVKDEAHINTQTGASIWNGDNQQYMIDPTGNRTDTSDVVYEFGYALAGANSDEPTEWRWLQNANAPADFSSEFAIVRDDAAGTTTYEVCLPKEQIAPAELFEGNTLGFGIIANDGDPGAEGQAGWVGWGSHAIVFGKDATELQELMLSGAAAAVQPAGKLTVTWGSLKN